MTRRRNSGLLDNPILVGTVTILVAVVGVYLSYTAQNGLPFVPAYQVSVDLPNGDELVKDADVRIGGARVGLVLSITPEPAPTGYRHPVARVKMRLSKGVEPLPADTIAGVRLISVLGGKYVDLQPGSARASIPDGGLIPVQRTVPLVDLDQVFRTFGGTTTRGIRSAVAGLGDGLAGRGAALNQTLVYLDRALPPLQRVLQTLASPRSDLAGFVRNAAGALGALAPVSVTLGQLFADGAATLAALGRAGPALAFSIDQLPQTEAVGTDVLVRSEPALADAQAVLEGLRPATPLLAPAVDQLDSVTRAATPVFKRVPALVDPLRTTLAAVDKVARDPASTAAFKILGTEDFASFSASGFFALGAILKIAQAGQLHCNLAVPWLANFSSTMSEGDSAGTWLRALVVLHSPEIFQSGALAPDEHQTVYPRENATTCEAGNEPYLPGQVIGNVPGNPHGAESTTAPPPALARGIKAGLVPAPGSAR